MKLLGRIRLLTAVFIAGLAISGATAIPLNGELRWLVNVTGANKLASAETPPQWASWLARVQSAIEHVNATQPFLLYGTDWLAFGHFVIAIAFIGAWRDPVRNRWLFAFGIISCALIIPYALAFGALRGIPLWWRMVDCSFGVAGFVPLWFCWKWSGILERDQADRRAG